MRHLHSFARVLLVGTLLNASFARQATRRELPLPETIIVPNSGVVVSMLDFGCRPAVEVFLNGKGPYPFLLDTGASVIAVDADLQKELALPAQPGAQPGVSHLDQLRVGGAILHGVAAVESPRMLGLSGQASPRGTLGASSFLRCLLTLDYPGKKVTIRKGELPSADNRRIFEYEAGDVLPRIPVKVGGREFRPHADSGSPAGLTLPLSAEGNLPLVAKPVRAGRARTPAGEFPVFSAEVKEPLQIGDYVLASRKIELSDVSPGSPEPPVGTIGCRVLHEFVVTLDAQNHRIQLTR